MNKNLKKIFCLTAFLFIFSFIIIQSFIFSEVMLFDAEELQNKEFDYVIVLGAAVWGNEPSPALYNRLIAAYDFVKDKPDIKIIVCGGQGNGNITEAEAMKRFLVERGIDPSRIIKEEHSSSTFENLKYAKSKICANLDRPKVLIVTSDFHLFRAKFLAKRLGFEAHGIPAETPTSTRIAMFFREYLAVIKSLLVDH
jgi:uncharacterized SAM-binding protein YcdF (DUF218 family)